MTLDIMRRSIYTNRIIFPMFWLPQNEATIVVPYLGFRLWHDSGIFFYWGMPRNSLPLREYEQPNQQQQLVHKPFGCQVLVGGHSTYIEPNQAMNVNGRWASCEQYDGHPVLIYGDHGNLAK